MNTVADKFVEYNSMDASGKQISPSSNVLTFTKGSESKMMENIISSADAQQYSLSKVFTDWQPNNLTAQIAVSGVAASGQTISWKKGNASNEYFVPAKYYTYKANNASEVKSYVSAAAGATLKVPYGAGVNKSRSVSLGDTDGQTTGICDFTEAASVLSTCIFTLKGNGVHSLQPGLNIVKTTYSDGHTDVKKVLKK